MTKPISLVERLRAVNKSWIEVYMNDKPTPALSETINTSIQAADEIERLKSLVREMLELADNWPGIAYTYDLETRARAACSVEPSEYHPTDSIDVPREP